MWRFFVARNIKTFNCSLLMGSLHLHSFLNFDYLQLISTEKIPGSLRRFISMKHQIYSLILILIIIAQRFSIAMDIQRISFAHLHKLSLQHTFLVAIIIYWLSSGPNIPMDIITLKPFQMLKPLELKWESIC